MVLIFSTPRAKPQVLLFLVIFVVVLSLGPVHILGVGLKSLSPSVVLQTPSVALTCKHRQSFYKHQTPPWILTHNRPKMGKHCNCLHCLFVHQLLEYINRK